jgi:hypothetical protein
MKVQRLMSQPLILKIIPTTLIGHVMTYHYLKDLHWCKGDRFYYIGVGCITSKPYKGCCLNLCLSHIDLALGSGLVCDKIEVTMSEEKNRKTKVMIIEDEEDILVLFRDYLSSRGHHVVCCCRSANHVVTDFEKSEPDICLIDYILGGKSNGIDAAIEILKKSPSIDACHFRDCI